VLLGLTYYIKRIQQADCKFIRYSFSTQKPDIEQILFLNALLKSGDATRAFTRWELTRRECLRFALTPVPSVEKPAYALRAGCANRTGLTSHRESGKAVIRAGSS
jgi:hypothetical protein